MVVRSIKACWILFAGAYGPYFGVLAAALVLLSWLISNTYVEHMKDDKERMKSIVTTRDDQEQFSRLSQMEMNLEKQLTRIEERLPPPADLRASLQLKVYDATKPLQWIQIVAQDIENLYRFGLQLDNLAKPMSGAKKLKAEISACVQEIDKLREQHLAEQSRYDSERSKLFGGRGVSLTYFAEEQPEDVASALGLGWRPLDCWAALTVLLQRRNKAAALGDLVAKHHKLANEITVPYLSLSNRMLDLSAQLSTEAKNEADRSAADATWAQRIAVVFYVIGTVLAIYGKAQEVRDKERSGIRNPAEDATIELPEA
jgi:hypothetical protein